jgi:predicted enzyme related to lactoylglutathione lyase
MSNRIVHFEIHANEPERAAEFYKKVFGWEITKWDSPEMEYWMVMTAPKDSTEPGINGGMIRRKDCDPATESKQDKRQPEWP